ncbi:D-isomer specific 2-hydroxyacid dehydrogenase [Zopfochytrium polystomum]|nr:D-isomer specific 2-hydroxyacid dehydrogenase [Zopfochytrium polystomum]
MPSPASTPSRLAHGGNGSSIPPSPGLGGSISNLLLKESRALLLDPLPQAALDILIDAGFTVEEAYEPQSEADLVRRISDYHLVCLDDHREDLYLSDEVIRSAHRLLAIGVFGGQTQSVDLHTAQTMGIPVFNAPFQHQNAIAELCISFIVLLARQIGDRSREIHEGEWNKVSANCYEIRGKTLGILGYTRLGGQLGVMAEAMGMRVVFWDEQAVMPIGRAESRATIDAVLAVSDYVVLNLEPSKENTGVIGKKELATMKKGSYLINPSFGDAVDVAALADALKSGHLAGAAIDALPSPPAPTPETPKPAPDAGLAPLRDLKNVLLTPSLSSHKTSESAIRIANEVATSLAHFVHRGSTVGAANFPSIAASWPLQDGVRRICNVHRNVRGVLREIDYVVGNYNVGKQVLDTKEGVGYLVVDVQAEDLATEVVSQLAVLSHSIRTRIL